jgi:Uma2 family endonuclease
MTPEEYLAFDEQSNVRHEYVDGYVYAFAGGTWRYNDVTVNLLDAIRQNARERGCRTALGNIRLRVTERIYYYPDLMVVCDRQRDTDNQSTRPILVAEVLSRSTASVDQREKLMAYRQIDSLETYLIVHQDEPRVEYHWRDEGSAWRAGEVIAEGDVPILSLDLNVPLSAIYAGIEFDPADDGEDYPAQ